MENKEIQVSEASSPGSRIEPWKLKIFVISGIAGVSLGLFSAYLLIKNAERSGHRPTVSAREGMQLGLMLFGTVRSVASLWEK
jgi:hypothetical protein